MEDLFYKRVSKFNEFDDKQGIIKGYANVYNVVDLQGDISMYGSFTKTVTERKNKIKIFKNHNSILVGVPTELDIVDRYGLGITAKMLLNTDEGRNTYQELKFLFENGFEAGFSIGGWVIKRNGKNKAEVQEYRLKEISVLTTEEPANQLSVINTIKSINLMDDITKVEFWKLIEKAYSYKFTDNVLESLEDFLSLKDMEPNDITPDIEPTKEIINIYKLFV